ncbi:MAG: hypothetical protein AB7K67_00985 [Hyphomicrobiaceae bacterium]
MPATMNGSFPFNDILALQGAFVVLSDALNFALARLREDHGNAIGAWFDEIETEMIKRAKGFTTEDMSIDAEAQRMKPAVEFLMQLIDLHRRSLDGPRGGK